MKYFKKAFVFWIIISVSAGLICPGDFLQASTAKTVVQNVPFSSQAPFGKWKDQRQQDGCEEMSAIMAIRWVKGKSLTRKEAETELFKIADFEQKNFKSYRDTNAQDTVKRIFKGYYKYEKAAAKSDPKLEDIISEVQKGNIVIIPANGQALGNPYFTAPGPDRHMVLIKGYDPVKKEFITNDPGTRRGENYRYKEKVLFNAIRDYPTGNHLKITDNKKAMIVVWK